MTGKLAWNISKPASAIRQDAGSLLVKETSASMRNGARSGGTDIGNTGESPIQVREDWPTTGALSAGGTPSLGLTRGKKGAR
jgi:hypothetical protein